MSDKATTWELRLKDLVLGPMKKLQELANGTQNKLMGVQGGLDKLAKMSNVMGRDFKRNYGQLDNLLENLKRKQSEAFNVKHIQAYQRMIDKTRVEMERLNKVTAPPQLSKWQQFKKGFNVSDMASQIPGVGGMLGFATNPYTLAIGGAIALGTATTKLAVDYETGMAKINATAQLSSDSLGKLKNRLVEIGSKSGGNFELMPQAYEKILSQTNNVNLSLDILETSVKGAKAGFTDIDTVAGALAQTLSVVGEKNTTANEVMDTLLKAKAVGAGEFADFAQYLPQLTAAGANLSVGFKDVAGVFSYMTAKGQSATDAAMLMQNAFTALQKKEVINGLSKKGLDLFNVDGSRKNIALVFTELSKKLSGLTDKGKTKFLIDIGLNDAQARNAFSVLTSDSEKFKKIMYDVNHALGETDKQLASTANTARTWGDIGDQFKAIGLGIGDYILPVIDNILGGIIEFGKQLKNIVSSDWWSNFFGAADEKKSIYKKALNNQLDTNAWKIANQKFGAFKQGEDMSLTKKRNEFVVDIRDKLSKGIPNANNIVPDVNGSKGKDGKGKNGKETHSAEDLTNGKGKIGTGSTGTGSSLSGSGGSNGNKSLTQNLYITVHIKKSTDVDDGKLQRKITDVIVDAGRDGLVTLGI